ncbi:MAG: hypothetical protein IJK78_15700 [Bacteroidales bacterium]|nr:hypothetical protein [Bacteroidales bacterium]
MKTNITIDNYEAFLLDYMEGNLSPDEAVQLKAFVAAQGMDWDELTEELPHLEAPAVTYQGKENLKKKGVIVPLYVKIASAAAAAGLLLTVTLWPEKSMPRVEPIANLKPIEVSKINTNEPIALLPRRATESINPLPRTGIRGDDLRSKGHLTSERTAMPLLAELPTKTATALQIDLPWTNFDEPDFDLMAYRMNTELAMMSFDGNEFSDDTEEERDLSLIGKGIYLLTDGRHNSFASIISTGLSTAKKELNLAATDIALTAYYRADERFEEAKENWQDKRGE